MADTLGERIDRRVDALAFLPGCKGALEEAGCRHTARVIIMVAGHGQPGQRIWTRYTQQGGDMGELRFETEGRCVTGEDDMVWPASMKLYRQHS